MTGNSKARVAAKLEFFNPASSVKDRIGVSMILAAEREGKIKRGDTLVEPTSGNTGIALAWVAAARGYKLILTMPESMTTERRKILQLFGAEVVLTPAKEGVDGAIRKAHQALNEEPDKYYMPNQFGNENNVLAHYETTGPEVFSQTDGKIDVFVAGMGTTGTLVGAGKYLKEKKQGVKIVGVEPTEGHTIQGLKNMNEAIVPRIYYPEILDEKVIIEDDEAFETTRLLAIREGLFVGMSSGAAVAGALRIARNMNQGTIVVALSDRGERYLSTTLFRSICAECPP